MLLIIHARIILHELSVLVAHTLELYLVHIIYSRYYTCLIRASPGEQYCHTWVLPFWRKTLVHTINSIIVLCLPWKMTSDYRLTVCWRWIELGQSGWRWMDWAIEILIDELISMFLHRRSIDRLSESRLVNLFWLPGRLVAGIDWFDPCCLFINTTTTTTTTTTTIITTRYFVLLLLLLLLLLLIIITITTTVTT